MKRLIQKCIAKTGYEIRRIHATKGNGIYDPHPTCQVPILATIYTRVFGDRSNGFFVEVGAFDGETYSNTSCLSDKGWSGIYVEPVPSFAEKTRRRHAHNSGVRVVQSAAGNTDGEIEMHVASVLSTANPKMLDEYQGLAWTKNWLKGGHKVKVKIARLDDILEANGASAGFELLVIDTEGFEPEVLAGFDIERWKPQMIIIELAEYNPDFDRRAEDEPVSRRIESAGYRVIFKDSVNTIFLRD
jgi:FkbM family methyltransferase